jgi:thioredoxin 1
MSNIIELNENNFDKETAEGITLVDFWAPWCGPCKMLGPILEKVAEELGEKVQIAKINVDDSPKLAQKFGVRSIPAIFIIKNGKIVKQFVGLQDKSQLVQAINNELD